MAVAVDDQVKVDPRSLHRLCYRSMQFRAVEGAVTDGRTLEGYAAVFDSPTTIESWEGEFEEVVKRGAFRRTLGTRTPVMQFDHGNDKRTGSVPIGAIQDIREDAEGLFVRARLFDNELVEPIRQAVEGQAIRGMSFKFRVMNDRWTDASGEELKGSDLTDLMDDPGDRGPLRREITEVDLFELGPVVFPAYDATSVGVRGILAQFNLDARCVHRHLSVFGPDERLVLARELVKAFPELRQVLGEKPADAPPPPESDTTDDEKTSPELADGTSGGKADPASRYSAHMWEPADWYLPTSSEVL